MFNLKSSFFMKAHASLLIFCLVLASNLHAQTVSTTTIPGSLRVNDSLQVAHNIGSAGNIHAAGDMVAQDNMHAQKDAIVDGNANIGTNLTVSGNTKLNGLRVNGPLILQTNLLVPANPCFNALVSITAGNGEQLVSLSPSQVGAIEALADINPCPTPPVIPFTWQTHGNHVTSSQRWIGTIEHYDFNIKTNNTFQIVCKANGDIGLGAFGGNMVTTTGKKYRMFIANSGEVSAGIQDASGKYPFVVKPNGATSIGIPATTAHSSPYMLQVSGAVNIGDAFPINSAYMLTVNGRIGAREIKVSIQNPWPDYVFEKSYELKSLEKLEEYVALNKHLPGVPDARSLEREVCGLDLAQMQGLQMEKIEEIYLHLIEMNKAMKELKRENEKLKQQFINRD
jgi:hypothetical protein